jgi:hypothetical protein
MLLNKVSVAILVAIPALPAFAASNLATGPNAVVPAGAPLPSSYVPQANAACDNLGLCGEICPDGSTIFVADFAYDIANDRFAVVDVPSVDGIFWMDGKSCAVSDYTAYAGISQRGCALDNDNGVVYTGSWNDLTIWRLDMNFRVLGSQYIGESFAGLAVSEEDDLLYAATNAETDELIEYAILVDGSLDATGNRWPMPWGGFSDGYSAASLEYDDCSQTFISINQDANTAEYFQLQGDSLVNVGYCALPLGFGWGFGLNFSTVELKVADIQSFACPFPVISIEPDEMICGGGEVPDLSLRYNPLTSTAIRFYKMPSSVFVKNNTEGPLTRVLWAHLDFPAFDLYLGTYLFHPGESQIYENAGPITVPTGTYRGQVHLSETYMGAPDASADFSFYIKNKGIQ